MNGPGGASDPRTYEDGIRSRRGFTAIEVIVVLTLLSLLVAAAAGVLISQQRYYTRHADVAATRGAARVAAELLAAELRGVSVDGGGLYGFASDSLAIRSSTGIGIVCGVSGRTLVLRRVSGVFGDLPTDSALLFVEHATDSPVDDEWWVARIEASRMATSPACVDGAPPDVSLVLSRDLEGVGVGSPVRSFRPYVYKLYLGGDGRWWLGQRLRNGRMQPVTGPMAPPGESGLRLRFLDPTGAPTDDPARVARVGISIIAEGRVRYPWRGMRAVFKDSLAVAAWVRRY
jgi:prepilin-type N-terminal cleavage/methylation domain-containing protein